MKAKEYIGKRFGMLTIKDVYHKKTIANGKPNSRAYALCECDCGNIKEIRLDTIINKKRKTVSCGCYNQENNYIKPKVNVGDRFGMLTVLEHVRKNKDDHIWKCRCDCGNIVEKTSKNIIRVGTCGKHAGERMKENEVYKKAIEMYCKDGTNLSCITSKKVPSHNTSGVRGVVWDKARSKWKAQINFQGKCHSIRFDTKEEAILGRKMLEQKYFQPVIDKYYDSEGNLITDD